MTMATGSTNLEDVPSVNLMTELLHRLKCANVPDKRLILVGPPESGKSTQSPLIKDEYYLCHLATGDMVRVAVSLMDLPGEATPKFHRRRSLF